MTPQALANWLGISPNTIRGWADMDRFGRFLSPTGAGGDGKRRRFSEQDQRLIAHIAHLKFDEGFDEDSIALALTQLQQSEWQDLPPMPLPAEERKRATLGEQGQTALELRARVDSLLQETARLQKRIDALEGLREVDRREIIDLREQLAKTQTLLELYESGRLKPEEGSEADT